MTDDRQERRSSDITASKLVLASFGSLVATFVLGRVGVAGTLIGAALTPILIALAQELVRRPIRRVRATRTARVGSSARTPRERRLSPRSQWRWLARRVSWRSVLATAGVAFAIVVAGFTIADFAAGDSVVADRPSTFFPAGSKTRQQPGETGTTASTETETSPAETDTEPVETAPVETDEAPPETDVETTPEPVITETEPPPIVPEEVPQEILPDAPNEP